MAPATYADITEGDLFSYIMSTSEGGVFKTPDGTHVWDQKQFFGRKLLSQLLDENGHLNGPDVFAYMVFKYSPEYLDLKIDEHYGDKSMIQLIAALFVR